MKKFIMMAVLAVSIVTGKAQNLLTNGDFDHEDIRHELRTNWVADTCDVSLFTEDYTWNKCLKLKVNKIIDENQVRKVYALMLFGADGKLAGFSVKPNTVYQVSLELRGTVPGVSLKAALWNKDVESIWEEVEFTGVEPAANVQVTSKWTRIQGSFKTAANTKRAALGITLWGDSSQQSVFSWKPEQYLLVDNVTAKEKKNIEQNEPLINLSEMQAKKIITLPAQQIGQFNTYGKNQAASAKTFFSISRTANALHLEIDCYSNDTIRASVRDNGTKIWHDNVVEIFFGPGPQKDRLLSQFAVSAGGGRFMGNGVNELLDYGKWQAKSTINDNGWKLVVEIPFAALGFETEPSPGDLLGFNVCRQDISELSTWSPVRNGFHDPDNFNFILFGEKQDYVKKVLAELGECPKEIDEMRKDFASTQGSMEELYLKGEILRKSINNIKLGKSSYLLSVADLSSDFSFPYHPDHETIILNHEQPIALRSAINEQCPLPLTITNRSGRTASYRVMVHPNLKFNSYEISGLDNNFPGNQIEMFEGIVMKDGDNENSSQRFDALPRMNQSRTITVAAGQTGLIWVNFNCRRMNAGIYKGAIRVTPLGEAAKMENNIEYSGPAKDFPLVLEVLPIVLPMDNPEAPSWLMTSCETEDIYRAQAELGGRMIAVNPWSFRYTFNEKGEIISDVIIPELIKRVKTQMEWQKKHAYTGGLKFFVHFSAYGVFERQFLNKKITIGSPEWENAWKNNLLAIAANFAELGLSGDEWGIEILDEPNGKNLARDLQVCKIARETLPEIFLSVTWAAANFGHTPVTIRQFIPYLNDHCFWHGHIRNPAYQVLANEIRELGHHYSFYACSTSMRENLYRYFRLHAWKGFEFGAETIGLYIFIDAPQGTAGTTNWKMTPQGGIAYRSDDECISSIRMENFRRGLTDIAYLNVLKKMTAGRKTKAAEKANSFLQQAAKKAVVELIHEPKTADRLRDEAIEHILLLQKE